MALEFLKGILGPIAGGIINTVASPGFAGLVQTGLGAYSALKPPEPYPPELIEEMISSSREGRQLSREAFEASKKASEADRQITGARLQGLGRSQQLLASGLDTTSPVFRRLAAEEEGTTRRDFVDALKEYRNYMHRYGSGIINPSRRDEAVARTATRGFEDAQQKARNNVRNYLMATAEANRAVASAYGGGGNVGGYTPASTAGLTGAMQGIAGNRAGAAESRETGFANIVGGLQQLTQKPKETARSSSGFSLDTGTRPKFNWPGQDANNPLMG